MRRTLVLVLGLILPFAFNAGAEGPSPARQSKLGTPAQQQRARQWNRDFSANIQSEITGTALKPFNEIETTGFVAISGEEAYELKGLREAIAKNLPEEVSLIIYVDSAADVARLKPLYSPYLGERLKFLMTPAGGNPIWARDSLPFPVYLKSSTESTPAFGLVDSIYPQRFEPDAQFGKALAQPVSKTGAYFRGGNLLLDDQANCFAEIANEVEALSDPKGFIKQHFGCATVTLLEQQGGIGDVDERIKFLAGKEVLTDNNSYAKILKDMGYNVHRIPTTGAYYETYMNTLVVNGTMFVPQMGIAADEAALKAYRELGFKAVGVYTKTMANNGNGNIHCVTMNYPPGTFTPSATHEDFVEFAISRN